MANLKKFIDQLTRSPEEIKFEDVINVIDSFYHYTPTQFSNGLQRNRLINQAGENEGSCKIFSFADIHKLNKTETLNCFGKYYREDVLKNPNGSDHTNIRNFMQHGWEHIHFEGVALELKE